MRLLAGGMAVVIVLATGGLARADLVKLLDGRTIDGKVVRKTRDEIFMLVLRDGQEEETTVRRGSVISIKLKETPWDVHERRAKALAADDFAGHLGLADWCRDQGLISRAADLCVQALKLRPAHSEVEQRLEALKYRREDDGRWLPEKDYWAARGYVEYDGKWIPRDEAERLAKAVLVTGQLERRRHRLARLEESLEERRQAVAEARKSIEQHTDDASDRKAKVQEQMVALAKARAEERRLRELAPAAGKSTDEHKPNEEAKALKKQIEAGELQVLGLERQLVRTRARETEAIRVLNDAGQTDGKEEVTPEQLLAVRERIARLRSDVVKLELDMVAARRDLGAARQSERLSLDDADRRNAAKAAREAQRKVDRLEREISLNKRETGDARGEEARLSSLLGDPKRQKLAGVSKNAEEAAAEAHKEVLRLREELDGLGKELDELRNKLFFANRKSRGGGSTAAEDRRREAWRKVEKAQADLDEAEAELARLRREESGGRETKARLIAELKEAEKKLRSVVLQRAQQLEAINRLERSSK